MCNGAQGARAASTRGANRYAPENAGRSGTSCAETDANKFTETRQPSQEAAA